LSGHGLAPNDGIDPASERALSAREFASARDPAARTDFPGDITILLQEANACRVVPGYFGPMM
jgi:hypothetical protein